MKKTIFILFALFVVSSIQLNAQLTAKVYEDPNCERIVIRHKKIAILPLDVTMTDTKANKKNRVSPEDLERKALEYQKAFQNSMYAWFLKRKQKNKMIDVDIQDVDRTNTILKKNGILTSEDLENYTKDEIAQMLEVDAVFGGTVNTSSSFSKGGATALAIITGISVKTGDADVFIKLWDAKEGKMIWSFSRVVASNYANTTDDVVNYLMKRVSKRFPYDNR